MDRGPRVRAAIITVSDSCAAGAKQDLTGPALARLLSENGWEIVATSVIPDEIEAIRSNVKEQVAESVRLIVLTGGTGISPRDVTPEAIRPMLDKEVPGLGELMRLRGLEQTEKAALSRSLAGCIEASLIFCLPGSTSGATQSLAAVLDLLPHAIDLLEGKTGH
ncbi:MAG: MogA/MoaB family molybdenum cofactor biosynthesis protein [Acidobacteria bacterium]|nr:MAG: MogA/MoaB family molybdenum cofactor biosynthesis protein [Acidobacteriota bacterium]